MSASAAPPAAAAASAPHNPESDVRPELRAMSAYVPILPYDVLAAKLGFAVADLVKLDANENPYGPSAAARDAVARLVPEASWNVYPDPESRELREKIAAYAGVEDMGRIVVGAGADELIDLVMRLVLSPGDAVVSAPPTFGMYKFDADVNGAEVIAVPRLPHSFAVDVDAIEAEFSSRAASNRPRPKAIFLASPNNPDGSALPHADFSRLLALPALLVLDEAYHEFAPDLHTGTPVAAALADPAAFPNLVVLRTFSKWAGLAGLRVGYGVFPPGLATQLMKIKQPYNVSVIAQAAACASLSQPRPLLDNVAAMVAQRELFFATMAADLAVQDGAPRRFPAIAVAYPSHSNFVLCRLGGGFAAAAVRDRLMYRHGVLIRHYNQPLLEDCIRVSMGTPAQMGRFYAALEAVCAEGAEAVNAAAGAK